MSAPISGVRAADMICKTEGCGRPCLARGLCGRCYQRFRTSPDFRPASKSSDPCAVNGCDRGGRLKLGWCQYHYNKWRKYGDPEAIPPPPQRYRRPVVNGCMRCSRCSRMRPVDSFRINGNRGYRESWCRICRVAYMAEFRRENPKTAQQYRDARYANRYGLSLQEYEALFDAQKGRCGICGQIPERRLHVDHDHETGKVRGLLCGNCNRGLGMFQHDPRVMQLAIVWLEEKDMTGSSL